MEWNVAWLKWLDSAASSSLSPAEEAVPAEKAEVIAEHFRAGPRGSAAQLTRKVRALPEGGAPP